MSNCALLPSGPVTPPVPLRVSRTRAGVSGRSREPWVVTAEVA